jgi:hypothetical protein
VFRRVFATSRRALPRPEGFKARGKNHIEYTVSSAVHRTAELLHTKCTWAEMQWFRWERRSSRDRLTSRLERRSQKLTRSLAQCL